MEGVYRVIVEGDWNVHNLCHIAPEETMALTDIIACVASVSVLFRSKERPRNEILGFGRARNETRAIFRAVLALKQQGNACYAGYRYQGQGS